MLATPVQNISLGDSLTLRQKQTSAKQLAFPVICAAQINGRVVPILNSYVVNVFVEGSFPESVEETL